MILKIKNNFEKKLWACAECSTYRKISQFWRAVSRNLASEGYFKKSFTQKCIISKINFQKFVCLCVHIIFPQKILDKNFENFEYLKLCIFGERFFEIAFKR